MHAPAQIEIDAVVTEIVASALTALTEEIEIAILRSAYSHVVREAQDASCAIFTSDGRIVAQPIAIPGHLGSMKFMLEEVLREFPANTLRPGDVMMTNDPYRGGSHLPDIALFRPVFDAEKIIAFVGSIAHFADVGGMVPGSNPAHATELYQEGLIIPPVKLALGGEPNKTVRDFIKANVRSPDIVFGDLHALEAALAVGERRLHELCRRFGGTVLMRVMDDLIRTTRARVGEEIGRMPEGRYTFVDYMDHDGIDLDRPVKIACSLSIGDGRLRFDFTGTDPQVRGPLNAPLSKTWTTVFYCLMCVLPEDIAFNDGVADAIDIHIPAGTLLNPAHPAPVNARSITTNRIADAVLGAFGEALPERVGGQSCGTPTGVSFGGVHPQTGRRFVFYESYSGGMGGTVRTDGADAVSTGTSNAMNIPAEAVEIDYPIRITRYELVPDSGGPGRHRGGLGILREYEMLAESATMNVRGDRSVFAPRGSCEGGEGSPARYVQNPGTAGEKLLPSKYGGGRIERGERLRVVTPGGGGYGPAAARKGKAIEDDLRDGKVTKGPAR